MLNYSKEIVLIINTLAAALAYGQDAHHEPSGFLTHVNEFSKDLIFKPLNEMDKILRKIGKFDVSISHFEYKFRTHEGLDKFEKKKRLKILNRYDSSGFLLKKKLTKRCFGKYIYGSGLPFQMLNIGNGFYKECSWIKNEKKYERYMGVDAPVLDSEVSNETLIIEDTTSKMLFFLTNIDNPEYRDDDYFLKEIPPLTYANYQSIIIKNDQLEILGLVLRSEDFKDALFIVFRKKGFYHSKIAMTWENLKKHTLQEIMAIMRNIPTPNEEAKLCDIKSFEKSGIYAIIRTKYWASGLHNNSR